MTPGRVSEAMACAATTGLKNLFMHLDWNQASIDSNRVCREEGHPGDYVQWDPAEFAHAHDWNVVYVPDGKDFRHGPARPAARAGVHRQRPADRDRVPDRQGLAVRHRGQGLARRRPQVLLRRASRTPSRRSSARSARASRCARADAQKCGGTDPVIIEAVLLGCAESRPRGRCEANRDKIRLLADNLAASRERLQKRARQPRAERPAPRRALRPEDRGPAKDRRRNSSSSRAPSSPCARRWATRSAT